ncbi:DUF4292 domain-containing protein [Marivirga arenosa]|uniref:DUF4292 domain-containing protein n=1 Tax=Marivirga arenosa TaxID=3059076 RepID=A0AA51R9Y5_9BACT|nr:MULTISPECIES: DUF4292 domain-containing protein [unclassified Marivirga]WKK79628.1 DUF4292 domain-containing protein [Marivirga sp. BKB1-2]WMN06278.1 DUF4292 domain-containing protein [Marivirga sp. ABR2-2]
MTRLFSVLICFAVLVFTSCGKKILPTSSVEKEYALEKFDFDYLQAKSKIRFSSPDRNLSSSASIRMKRDSIIWVSVSPIFGIEAARGFISQDTIVFLDRVNKDVYRYNFKSLSNSLNFEIDFEMIQSILLGNQVFEFKNDDNFSKKAGELMINQKRGRFELETTASAKDRKVQNIKVREIPDGSKMEIIFSEFNLVDQQAFPFNAIVEIISAGTKGEESTQVQIEHSKVEVGNTPISFPFSVPSKYEN